MNKNRDNMAESPDVGLLEVEYNDLDFYERCGGGAFGSVYRAKWKSKDLIVAVKKVLVLEKEAHVLSTVRHKNIIQFYGAVTKPPNYCLVTEFAPNGSLYTYLASHQGDQMLTLPHILKWACDIGLGMNYLHSGAPVRVVHRDLKSKNIVISSDLVCKICDFGASKFHGSTTKMSFAGTLPWMAPEVIQGLPTSESCDIWSYGVVLWELLTHEVPFKGIEGFQVAWLVVEKDERLTIPKTCPQVLAKLMSDSWNKDPKRRPSFAKILKLLEWLKNDNETLGSICTSYLKNRSMWKGEIQSTLDRIKNKENDLNVKQKKLQEWEQRLEEKEQVLERQQYMQKLNSYDVNMWTEKDVHFWLKQMSDNDHLKDLARYADLFLEHNISGKFLLLLSPDELRKMGVISIGHLIGLQTEIERLHAQNKRMMEFPPLEQLVLHCPTSPCTESLQSTRLKIVLLFGSHIRRGLSEQEHKWKMYVEVDENDNSAAMACIKKVSFRHNESEQIIQQSPFVMDRWYTGISVDTKVECTVTYQSHVKKPRQTRYCHKIKLDGCKVHQREVEIIMKKSVLRQNQNSLTTSPNSPSAAMWQSRNRIVHALTPSPPPGRGIWAKIVASGRAASPGGSPLCMRKFSLPAKHNYHRLNVPVIHRTVSAPDSSLAVASESDHSLQATSESPRRIHNKGFKSKHRYGRKKKHSRDELNEDTETAILLPSACFANDDSDPVIWHRKTDVNLTNEPSDDTVAVNSRQSNSNSHVRLCHTLNPKLLQPRGLSDSGVPVSPESCKYPDGLSFQNDNDYRAQTSSSKGDSSNFKHNRKNSKIAYQKLEDRGNANYWVSSKAVESSDSEHASGSRNHVLSEQQQQILEALPDPSSSDFDSTSESFTSQKQNNNRSSLVNHKMDLKSKPPKGRGFRGIRGFHRSLSAKSRGRAT